MTTYPYSLTMLPVMGITDATADVGTMQSRVKASLEIVEGLRSAPFGMSPTVKQAIEDIRFHLINALNAIQTWLQPGAGNVRDPHVDVPGLVASIDSHIAVVRNSRPAWDAWLKDAYASKQPSEVLPKMDLVPGGAPASGGTGVLQSMQMPSVKDYVTIGLVTGGVLLVGKWLKFFK